MSTPLVLHGDCLNVLRELPDNHVHAIVTDPPYGLSNLDSSKLTTALTAWVNGDRERVPSGKGFMGKEWDAFVPPPAVWDECLRVLRPGGHMLVFAGSRTVDLMGLSIRLAGFEIRDTLQWLYGSGFPKSLDVSKAIDKQRDDRSDVLRVTSWLANQRDRAGLTNQDIDTAFGTAGMAGHWTSVKSQPAVPKCDQWERLRELIGFDDTMDAEVARLNGRKGTPGEAWGQREITRTRDVPTGFAFAGETYGGDSSSRIYNDTTSVTDAAREWEGWGTALKPAAEPIILARKPLASTVARNVLDHGVGGINIDGCRVDGGSRPLIVSKTETSTGIYGDGLNGSSHGGETTQGRFPANVLLTHNPECDTECDEGCPAAELDEQSGVTKDGNAVHRNRPGGSYQAPSTYGEFGNGARNDIGYGGSGGASRFFPSFRHHASFRYQAKAPKRERPKVDGVSHPTVKPLALMRWLVRLITPPGGTVLDPFAGSGTTLQAAHEEGFASIGVERDLDYMKLIGERLGREAA